MDLRDSGEKNPTIYDETHGNVRKVVKCSIKPYPKASLIVKEHGV